MSVPRSEHPKPQIKRKKWRNLNGEWRFDFDFGVSGRERRWYADPSVLSRNITVPFCPESKLSGIEYKDFMLSVWYHRNFSVPADWSGNHIKLHFGAVDYDCRVWINGEYVGRHLGGSSSFSFDVTGHLADGENQLVVNALDDVRSEMQPAGKQCQKYYSGGCDYTRTTGIWQTVWLEAVPEYHLEDVHVVPDYDGAGFDVVPVLNREKRGLEFRAILGSDGKEVATETIPAGSGKGLRLNLEDPHAWSCADPFLYDLTLEVLDDDRVIDRVESYAGLRKFHIEGNRFYLNNDPIFLRFVLDQGFYPDGIWTAPDDSELRADIERARAVGFNGARLHQKVFEERYHYWADRLGYLTWAEFADWGLDTSSHEALHNHQREWREVVCRDRNHPSIVAWTPYNEQNAEDHLQIYGQAVRETYQLTRQLDPTRPVNDASGWTHVETDIYTIHDYDQDPDSFRERYESVGPDEPEGTYLDHPDNVSYDGQPYVVDEYGGTFWTDEYESKPEVDGNREEWGYGKSADQVEERIVELTKVLLENPNIAGYTYTQLTDVEQEVNGIYTYDRELKFDPDRLKEGFGAKAAIEK